MIKNNILNHFIYNNWNKNPMLISYLHNWKTVLLF